MSYEFFTLCGLETLGPCEEFLNDDTPFFGDDNEVDNASISLQGNIIIALSAAIMVVLAMERWL